MLDKDKLKEVVENALAETEAFLVEITVTPANEVEVTIDSPEGIDIEMCVWLTRRIEAQFDVRNAASGRVMNKAGMKKEGVLRQRLYNKGEYIDVELWSMLASDYEQKQR